MPAPAGPSTSETAARRELSARELSLADLRHDEHDRMWTFPASWGSSELMAPLALSETERKFRFRGLPQAVGAARRVLREWERHFDPVLFYDLSLCVSELVTNRVRHGGSVVDSYIELAVRRSDELVRAEITEPLDDVVLEAPATMIAGDWGMFIVDRVADRWGVDHGIGTLVWCELDLADDGRSRETLTARPLL
jgi:anti-sigma regulatory factor (Ser/Thr protein kinase)